MDKQKYTPGVGQETDKKSPLDRMMEAAERGDRSLGTLRGSRPGDDRGIQRPFQPAPRDYATPPSKAPRGMANAVEGDLGAYRQSEAKKVFGSLPGKDSSNPLRYRKPQTGIDAKFGPGDKVC